MTDILALGVLVLILGAAIGYIVRQKKKGAKCIGCPHAQTCQSKCCQSHCSGADN